MCCGSVKKVGANVDIGVVSMHSDHFDYCSLWGCFSFLYVAAGSGVLGMCV